MRSDHAQVRSLTMTAPQVRALIREAEAPGTGMSQVSVPWDPQPKSAPFQVEGNSSGDWYTADPNCPRHMFNRRWRCPYAPGDMVYVCEDWAQPYSEERNYETFYRADGEKDLVWRFGKVMPRWASRLTLIVTDVQAMRVQKAISCAEAIAQGVPKPANVLTIDCDTPDPRQAYGRIWNARHGKRYPWSSNPWCWWLSFRPIARNVDDVEMEGAA